MLCLSRPSESRVRGLLDRSRGLPFSYPDVGSTFGDPPAGYVVDHNRVRLGEGARCFEQACGALRDWAMFRLGWAEVWPAGAPQAEGTTVAVAARGLGLWAVFACRVVRVVTGHGPVESLGFCYGTLPGHVLRGEERFLVTWDHGDDSVWYDLRAFSRPAGLLGRLGYPLVRRVQLRFAPASLRAMTRAAGGGGP